jgi:dTDP-4-dehydrorhamnose reductase
MKNCSSKILITGGDGQLGMAINAHPLAKTYDILSCSRANLDITNKDALHEIIKAHRPDIIINTAAYTAVDKAELEKDLAMQVNYLSVKELARLCHKHEIPLIHLSTDYIFNGEKTLPYIEDDHATPINVYGESKWLGEVAVRDNCHQHIILRVSSIFSEYGTNFVKTILRLAQTKHELRIVSDQVSCPTAASDIAHALYTIVKKISYFGTYHYCSSPSISWYQFALEIFERLKHKNKIVLKDIHAVSAKEHGAPAKRPACSVLNCKKIADDYGIEQPSWQNHLEGIIHECL